MQTTRTMLNQNLKNQRKTKKLSDGDARSVIMYMRAVNFHQTLYARYADMDRKILNQSTDKKETTEPGGCPSGLFVFFLTI